MKLLVPLAVVGLLIAGADSVHPQPYDRGPGAPQDFAPQDFAPPPPPPDDEPPRRMICIIDTPFPYHQQRCATRSGYPGSPCRCEGSLFEGERVIVE